MAVKRIVANIASGEVAAVRAFYVEVFDLDVVMDQGWISTLAVDASARPQLSIASEGGSGTDVPSISIEVEDVDAVHARAQKTGCAIPYPLTDEPWGVRRFYLRDPADTLVNVLSHLDKP